MQKKFIWNFAGNARKWTSLQTTFSWGKLCGKIIWREYLKCFNIWREHSRYFNIWGEYSRYFNMRTEYFNSIIFLQESCLGRNRGADRESPRLSISSSVNISMGAFVGLARGLRGAGEGWKVRKESQFDSQPWHLLIFEQNQRSQGGHNLLLYRKRIV